MDIYALGYEELKELVRDSLELQALKAMGVENWAFYQKALEDFIGEDSDDTLDDLAMEDIDRYYTREVDWCKFDY